MENGISFGTTHTYKVGATIYKALDKAKVKACFTKINSFTVLGDSHFRHYLNYIIKALVIMV